jgi:uncharacterized membrane protein
LRRATVHEPAPCTSLRIAPIFFEAGVTNAAFAPNVYESAERLRCVSLVVAMTRLLFGPNLGFETAAAQVPHRQGAGMMTANPPNTERLNAFSDAVFAVVITILALDLRPPHAPTFDALFELWPTVISYAVSYLFIAIVWVNHHHLLHYASAATPRLIWGNFAHLFSVSLLPFSTAWIASARLAPLPVTVYAGIFAMVNATYLLLCREAADRPGIRAIPGQARTIMRMRSWTTLLGFLAAATVSLHYPMFALAMICICLTVYLKPQVVSGHAPHLASEDTAILQAARHPSSGTKCCPSSRESRPQQRPNRPA